MTRGNFPWTLFLLAMFYLLAVYISTPCGISKLQLGKTDVFEIQVLKLDSPCGNVGRFIREGQMNTSTNVIITTTSESTVGNDSLTLGFPVVRDVIFSSVWTFSELLWLHLLFHFVCLSQELRDACLESMHKSSGKEERHRGQRGRSRRKKICVSNTLTTVSLQKKESCFI